MSNPFTLSFGKEPTEFISRLTQTNEIVEDFTSEDPVSQVYMITGVRGSGKTVMLTKIKKMISEYDDWIVVELSPVKEMLNTLVAKLYSDSQLNKLFITAKIDLSKFGLGVSFENEAPAYDVEIALAKMLTELKKKGKKLLIAVDETIVNDHVREFASIYQILMREDYPIFLIMTGLFENIYDLQNQEGLTFLFRAPKVVMAPLSIGAISKAYERIFVCGMERSKELANLTLGYPYAFQVLGYLYWDQKDNPDMQDVIKQYDQYLEEYVYEKIWSELSFKDKDVVGGMVEELEKSDSTMVKNSDLRERLGLSSGEMSVYRDRLVKKGLIDTSNYGYMSFRLPRFKEIARYWI
ncbi:MAG: ATP-binding protein [Eubacterium sp.]|nr:ATP-binding protein [Eubacterium sp.]